MERKLQIISGSSHPELAMSIYKKLRADADDLNVQYVDVEKVVFGNENMLVKLQANVREADVFFIQTSSSPVSDNIIESLLRLVSLKIFYHFK